MNWSLPAFAIRHPVTLIMFMVTVTVLGCVCWYLCPLDAAVAEQWQTVDCMIPFGGAAGPDEVERLITVKAEEEFRTLPHIRGIYSRTDSWGASLHLKFDYDIPIRVATAEVRDRAERLKLRFPKGADRIYLSRAIWQTQNLPIMNFALFRQENQDEMARFARTVLRNRLIRIKGVAQVSVSGRASSEIYVEFDPNTVQSLNLSMPDILRIIQSNGLNISVGELLDGDKKCFICALNELGSQTDLGNIVIGPNSVRLRDVARITTSGPSGAEGFMIDGKRGVFVDIIKESDANTIETCQAIRQEIERLKAHPAFAGTELLVFDDKAVFIVHALDGVKEAARFGGILAVLILFLFLWEFKSTFIIALNIPLSLVGVFIYVYFAGKTINMVTMAAMITCLGMLVDDAIVVMENIYRFHQMGCGPVESARRGASEVMIAITASTLTTVVVGFPVFYVEKSELYTYMTEFIGPVAISLVSSLFVSITLIPLVAAHMRPRLSLSWTQRMAERFRPDRRLTQSTLRVLGKVSPIEWSRRGYGRLLHWIMMYRLAVVVMIGALLVLTVLIPYQRVGTRFLKPDQQLDQRRPELSVSFQKNYDYAMAKTIFERFIKKVEEQREELGIKHLFVDYGAWGGVVRAYLVQPQDLKPGQTIRYSTDDVREIFSEQFPDCVPGGTVEFGIAKSNYRNSQVIALSVRGDDTDTLLEYAERFEDLLRTLPDVHEAWTDTESAEHELQIHVNPGLAIAAGATPLTVARAVDFALNGTTLPYIRHQGVEIPVRAQFGWEHKKSKNDIEKLPVGGTAGKQVALANISDMSKGRTPGALNRENGKTVIRVFANVDNKDMVGVGKEIRSLIANIDLPRGYSIETGEQINEIEKMVRNFASALVLTIILIYVIMATLFESCLLPLSILTTVPLAFVGVYWTMYLSGLPMDLVSLIGCLLLCGVIVKNGIVIVDHISQLRRQGMNRFDAILQAGHDRFRPVVMTALTSMVGCIPIAADAGRAQEPFLFILNGLGRTMIGGLGIGTILTLVLVPLAYSLIDDAQAWVLQYSSGLARMLGWNASAAERCES